MRTLFLQVFDLQGECVNRRPIGKFDRLIQFCRSASQPHDEANHLPVHESVLCIIDPAAKRSGQLRRPRSLIDKFLKVRITGRPGLVCMTRHTTHGKEGTWQCAKRSAMLPDEVVQGRAMPAITNARTDHNTTEAAAIPVNRFFNSHQHNLMTGVFEKTLNRLADFSCMTING
ncbi:MAG: hypothetical protein REI95_11985 [Oxalicibacterium faecigallinarum]|nr:hypothetical protein [Oxalicibacterium faecigallinarum]MDQ7970354.1 hypothetical protein [Oxalicibacterium faecigallinarum]